MSPSSSASTVFSLLLPFLLITAAAVDSLVEPAAQSDNFRQLNRKRLSDCTHRSNPYLSVEVSTGSTSGIRDEENVVVTVSGVMDPDKSDWVALISPANSDASSCPLNFALYEETGDFSSLPLLCHYPVKAQYVSNDPSYLTCEKKQCKKRVAGVCVLHTCNGTLTFHVVNFRTQVEFAFFSGGFGTPCLLKRSDPVAFANPRRPLHGHVSSVDSTSTSVRLTWVSGDGSPQQVKYGNGNSAASLVTTFTQDDMCGDGIPSPGKDFGWHDPGYIHSAIMTNLNPSQNYTYRYGSESVGWSDQKWFKTPPAAGSDELSFIAYGDMGKAPLDKSTEHFIQPGSISVVKAIADEVVAGRVDMIFHIGDVSYATGFLVEWDYFLKLVEPVASHVPYMTAIGNHERDYPDSGSVYFTTDSGGECGVPYETYFQMPTSAKDKPWYSIEQASVHFTLMSTEHDWHQDSEQYQWIKKDLESVDRTRTPWVIFAGHRPMYSSGKGILPGVDPFFVAAVEPLLMNNKVNLALFGHVHNYERTCAVYQGECKGRPVKGADGVDTYHSHPYAAPVHVVVGMAGFDLDGFQTSYQDWSLKRIAEYGYTRIHATRENLTLELVNAATKGVKDKFRITKARI